MSPEIRTHWMLLATSSIRRLYPMRRDPTARQAARLWIRDLRAWRRTTPGGCPETSPHPKILREPEP